MQTLVSIALGDLFPEQYRKWHAKKQNVRDVFFRERKSRKHSVAQDVTKTEGSLRSALREEVVNHVISLFPYCFHRFDLETALIWSYTGLWFAMASLPIHKLTATPKRGSKVDTPSTHFFDIVAHSFSRSRASFRHSRAVPEF